MESIVIIYPIIMSCLLLIYMYVDKARAKKHEYRISEKTLWTIAVLGGACGGVIGMQLFRHKTKHISFKIGFPFLAIMQLIFFIKLISII